MPAFRTRRKVEFADTDREGIVHFARYLVYMETAEHELLAAAGVGLSTDPDGVPWVWPRVEAACEYLAPLRFRDEVEIEVRLAARGRSSLTWEHTLRRGETTVARGRVKAVCCRRAADGTLAAAPIHDAAAAALDAYR